MSCRGSGRRLRILAAKADDRLRPRLGPVRWESKLVPEQPAALVGELARERLLEAHEPAHDEVLNVLCGERSLAARHEHESRSG